MLNRTQIREGKRAYAENPAIGRGRMRRVLGCSGYAAEKFLKEVRSESGVKAPVRPGVPVREFAGKFNYKERLMSAIAEHCSGHFVTNSELRALSGIPGSVFQTVSSLPEFASCRMADGGVIWWSTKANVDAVRASAAKWGIRK